MLDSQPGILTQSSQLPQKSHGADTKSQIKDNYLAKDAENAGHEMLKGAFSVESGRPFWRATLLLRLKTSSGGEQHQSSEKKKEKKMKEGRHKRRQKIIEGKKQVTERIILHE